MARDNALGLEFTQAHGSELIQPDHRQCTNSFLASTNTLRKSKSALKLGLRSSNQFIASQSAGGVLLALVVLVALIFGYRNQMTVMMTNSGIRMAPDHAM